MITVVDLLLIMFPVDRIAFPRINGLFETKVSVNILRFHNNTLQSLIIQFRESEEVCLVLDIQFPR